jgi:hypothetical protein
MGLSWFVVNQVVQAKAAQVLECAPTPVHVGPWDSFAALLAVDSFGFFAHGFGLSNFGFQGSGI